MKFHSTLLPGVMRIDITPKADERGMFARLYCPNEFESAGIAFEPVQMNLSRNTVKHTLRGMHFQLAPFAEAKVVRAIRGAIYDVVVDLRRDSPTYTKWISANLSADAGEALFIPEGCAHGFMTLSDATDVHYLMGRAYVAGMGLGVRWNDPALNIQWPHEPALMDAKDSSWPDLEL